MLQRAAGIGLILTLLASPGLSSDAPSGPAAPSPETQSEMTFQKTVHEVRLDFHVSSHNGRPVSGVQKDQFTVYQDGQAVNGVTGFYADDNLPLRLVLMIDSSASMSKGFDSEREAASGFVRRVVRPDVDRSTVFAFSNRVAVIAGSDASSPEAMDKIEQLHSAGLTALFDSICEAASQAGDREPRPARRVLVLLSDGDDNYSRHSVNDAIAAALSSDLVIYAVTAHNPKDREWGDINLEKLTSATGGRVFFLKKYGQSEKTFSEIEQEIRSQYTVTFRPAGSTCGFHNVTVEPDDHSLRTRLRTGFYRDCS